jgi:hypothetical protein
MMLTQKLLRCGLLAAVFSMQATLASPENLLQTQAAVETPKFSVSFRSQIGIRSINLTAQEVVSANSEAKRLRISANLSALNSTQRNQRYLIDFDELEEFLDAADTFSKLGSDSNGLIIFNSKHARLGDLTALTFKDSGGRLLVALGSPDEGRVYLSLEQLADLRTLVMDAKTPKATEVGKK